MLIEWNVSYCIAIFLYELQFKFVHLLEFDKSVWHILQYLYIFVLNLLPDKYSIILFFVFGILLLSGRSICIILIKSDAAISDKR